MGSIKGFFGPYRFLSNFHFVQVELDGEIYRTVEHAYQAAKTVNLEQRKSIQVLSQPKDARRAGQLVTYRPNWEQIKLDVMYDLNCQKFSTEPLSEWLLDTQDWYLEETNWWKDTFWGVCNDVGQNNLGKLLMQIRADLVQVYK